MAFHVPRLNVVESDEGFSVEVLGRAGLRYSEAGNAPVIDSEILAGPSGLALFTRSLDHLDEEEKMRIVENVRAAFRFQGFDIQVL